MSSPLCPDAGILLKLYLPEPGSREARELVAAALTDEGGMLGPAFLPAEVLSVLRREARRGAISPEQAEAAVASLLALSVEEIGGPEVYRRAWEIAGELDLPVVYDAVYLAVAELRGAVFWTADRELYDKARGKGYVRLLGGPS